MSHLNDIKMEAVNIGVTLSTQLISAALTMIAVLGAFATFIMDKREIGIYYYFIVSLSFLFFVVSIFMGGKGIDISRKNGFEGNWNLIASGGYFNYQAISCFVGLFCFIFSIFIGNQNSTSKNNTLTNNENEFSKIIFSDSIQQVEVKLIKDELYILKQQFEELTISYNTIKFQQNKYDSIIKPNLKR